MSIAMSARSGASSGNRPVNWNYATRIGRKPRSRDQECARESTELFEGNRHFTSFRIRGMD